MRLALIVEYEGTNYHGFQYQVNAPSIQEELEKAIAKITGERLRVKAAGRTDTGVHAKGQVVAFDTTSTHSPGTFVQALNFHLPEDIAVRATYQVGEGFDPRRDALSRRYRYTVLNSPTSSPLMRRTACQVAEPLDVGKMDKAASLLVGTHDFADFAGPMEEDGAITVRHIYGASVHKVGELLTFDVVGNAFLRRQVRRMAGALVDVGRSQLSLDEFRLMIVAGNGEAVAPSLPPQGLCLMEVSYADFPSKVGDQDGNEY